MLHGSHVEFRYCMNMIKTKSAVCSDEGHYIFYASEDAFTQNSNPFAMHYMCQMFSLFSVISNKATAADGLGFNSHQNTVKKKVFKQNDIAFSVS